MNADDFAVPMFYDTRFQRTPFDPMGRPPVALDKTAAKQQLKKKDQQLSMQQQSLNNLDRITSKQAVAAQLDQPISLWEQMSVAQQLGEEENDEEEVNVMTATFPSSSSSTLNKSNTWQFSLHDHHQSHHASEVEKPALTLPPIASAAAASNQKKRTTSQQHKDKEKEKPDFIHRNMMVRPLDAFKETHRCHFPGCGEVFSRLYTFKVHLKTHEMFPQYYSYKQQPQLYND